MPIRQHPITSDALAIWRFNTATGDVPDLTGNGNTAVEYGTVPAQVGQFGTARGSFSQVNYFRASDSVTLRPTVFTFAYWVYWASSSQNLFAKAAGIENVDDSFTGTGQLTDFGSGVTTAVFYDTGQFVSTLLFTSTPVPVGWHHFGLTVDEFGVIKTYFDGQLVTTSSLPAGETPFYDGSDWWFGRDGNAIVDQSFNGWLEDVAVYGIAQPEWWFCWIAGGNDCFPPEICGKDLINKEDGYTLTHYECLPDQHRNVNNGGGVLSAPFSLGNRFMHIRRK